MNTYITKEHRAAYEKGLQDGRQRIGLRLMTDDDRARISAKAGAERKAFIRAYLVQCAILDIKLEEKVELAIAAWDAIEEGA